MPGPVFVDTNVIVSARDGRFPTQKARCEAWLKRLAATRSLVINVQVLKEYRNALRAKLRLDDVTAHEATRQLFPWCTAPLDVAEIKHAMVIEQRYRTSWWDALIVASAIAGACTILLTEDSHAAPVVAGLRIIDPATTAPEDILGAA